MLPSHLAIKLTATPCLSPRCVCKNRGFASHRHVSVAIGMTLREGAISFSALPMVRVIRVIKRPMRVRLSLKSRYSGLLSPRAQGIGDH